MAKKCMVEKEQKRKRLWRKHRAKRARLKAIQNDPKASGEEKWLAMQQLAKLPPNSAKNRQHNRCELTGRPRGYYRKFGISRIALRELASRGELPGVVKSSW